MLTAAQLGPQGEYRSPRAGVAHGARTVLVALPTPSRRGPPGGLCQDTVAQLPQL